MSGVPTLINICIYSNSEITIIKAKIRSVIFVKSVYPHHKDEKTGHYRDFPRILRWIGVKSRSFY